MNSELLVKAVQQAWIALDPRDPDPTETFGSEKLATVAVEVMLTSLGGLMAEQTSPGGPPTYVGREDAAATGTKMTEAELADSRYPKVGWFRVIWVNDNNGLVFSHDIQAGSMADAAWQVARYMFDCFHPDGRRLLDVVRLS